MMANRDNWTDSLMQWGDDALILAQRTSEWCGHGPILEEDIALSNIALDLLGQSRNWLKTAGERLVPEKTEDDLAYFRTERQFRNHKLLELPNGDFGDTICRLYLWSEFSLLRLTALKNQAVDLDVQAIATKALKEAKYHVAHTREWMIRLGDGTEESHKHMAASLQLLMPYTGACFVFADVDQAAVSSGIIPSPDAFQASWTQSVQATLDAATLTWPQVPTPHQGGKDGLHTEHLGYILAEMQSLARTHPGVTW